MTFPRRAATMAEPPANAGATALEVPVFNSHPSISQILAADRRRELVEAAEQDRLIRSARRNRRRRDGAHQRA
jgi:hypothetical protein